MRLAVSSACASTIRSPSLGHRLAGAAVRPTAPRGVAIFPTEKNGRFVLVPRKQWDRKVKRYLRGPRSRRKTEAAAKIAAEVENVA